MELICCNPTSHEMTVSLRTLYLLSGLKSNSLEEAQSLDRLGKLASVEFKALPTFPLAKVDKLEIKIVPQVTHHLLVNIIYKKIR